MKKHRKESIFYGFYVVPSHWHCSDIVLAQQCHRIGTGSLIEQLLAYCEHPLQQQAQDRTASDLLNGIDLISKNSMLGDCLRLGCA